MVLCKVVNTSFVPSRASILSIRYSFIASVSSFKEYILGDAELNCQVTYEHRTLDALTAADIQNAEGSLRVPPAFQ